MREVGFSYPEDGSYCKRRTAFSGKFVADSESRLMTIELCWLVELNEGESDSLTAVIL